MQVTALTTGLSTLFPTATQADARGLTLGASSGTGAATGTAGTASLPSLSDTADAFAAEIVRRLQSAQTASNAGALVASGAAGDLQSALADTIDSVRQAHGDAAATAVMGLIVKGVGDGSGGEDALGDALVSALKFIDRNFGIPAGDAAMANFNGALNGAVNDYFQNGHEEMFYAADGSGGKTSKLTGVLGAAVQTVANHFGEDAAKTIADILAGSLEENGLTRQGLGTALAAADQYLKDTYATADTYHLPGLPGLTGKAEKADAASGLAKGSVLDLAV